MPVVAYTPQNWYWIVGGAGPHKAHTHDAFSGDESRVYSSARKGYVPPSDKHYQTWKKVMGPRCGVHDPTTRIDTEENLLAVLNGHGLLATFKDLDPE